MKRYPLSALAALVVSASLSAAIVEKPISYEHVGATLHGLLVYDEARVGAGDRLLGVLVIHQWMGRSEFEATQGRARAMSLSRSICMASPRRTLRRPAC